MPTTYGLLVAADRHTTSHRTIRGIDDELWEQASQIARIRAGGDDKRGALSAEVRAWLKRYVRTHKHLLDDHHAATSADSTDG